MRLLPSSSEQSPQNVLIYANGPPFSSCQIDFAGEFLLKDNLKTYCLVTVCSWSGAVIFQPLLSMTAAETLKALELSMASIGRTAPSKVYCDSAPSFLSLNQTQTSPETSSLSDPEYVRLRDSLTRAGIEVKAHAAYAPFRTGKVEAMVKQLKRMLTAHYGYLKDLTYNDFSYLVGKSAFLINSRPIGAYNQVMGTFCLSPMDILHPSQSKMHSSEIMDFSEDNKLWKNYNRVSRIFKGFKSMFLSLYIQTALKRNRKSDKRVLKVEDIVIILDRRILWRRLWRQTTQIRT